MAEIKDPRIRFFQKANGGAASARNFGLRHAEGKFVAYCDSDDIYYPNHLKHLVGFLEQKPEYGLVYSNAIFLDPNGEKRERRFNFDPQKSQALWQFVPSPSMVAHRMDIVSRVGFWDESEILRVMGEDTEFFLRIADQNRIGHFDEVSVECPRRVDGSFYRAFQNADCLNGHGYIIKKRLMAERKKKGWAHTVSPFSGYYFYSFLHIFEAVQYLKAISTIEITAGLMKMIQIFEEVCLLDGENMEVWLVLAYLYTSLKRIDHVASLGRTCAYLLDDFRRPEIDDAEIRNLISKSLKAIAQALHVYFEATIAEKYEQVAREFS